MQNWVDNNFFLQNKTQIEIFGKFCFLHLLRILEFEWQFQYLPLIVLLVAVVEEAATFVAFLTFVSAKKEANKFQIIFF